MTRSWRQALDAGRAALAGSTTAALDARVLLEWASGLDRAALIAVENEAAPAEVLRRFDEAIARRVKGEPVAYIRRQQEFYSRPFIVTPDVLIPRPETEMIVEQAVRMSPRRILDLGTGSGCLLVSILAEHPGATGAGVDLSAAALAVAARNAVENRVIARTEFIEADFAVPLEERFDLIVSNPPYIEEGAVLPNSVADFEPRMALRAGDDGLEAYRALAKSLPPMLSADGSIFLEIGATQGKAVAAMMANAFSSHRIDVLKDAAGLDRVVTVAPQAQSGL